MGMPQLIVTAVLVEGRNKSEVARDYGISRRWVITLVQRYLAQGEAGLQPKSGRPHRQPTRTASAVEDEIIAIRKDLDKHGHEDRPARPGPTLEGTRRRDQDHQSAYPAARHPRRT
jgi:transposase-like protein